MANQQRYQARSLLNQLADRLSQAGIASARLDANLIAQIALGRDERILSHHELVFDETQMAKLEALIARRLSGCPVSRLRGVREFYGLDFQLNEATLDPRPDSECLVEAARAYIADKPYHMADFGTGTGCLLIATLYHCHNATGLGLDLSEAAVQCARLNSAAHHLADRAHFQTSDWDSALDEGQMFDVILSNPPYISLDDRPNLAPEVVAFDPSLALFAGTSGLDAYQILMPIIHSRLKPHGACFIEIGVGQETDVISLGTKAGLAYHTAHRDLAGRIRCLHFVNR